MNISQMRIPKIKPSQLFFAVYLLIGAATFRHSTVGFASLEGSMEWGALSALAVDVLMILFAHAIRQDGLSWKLAFGLSIPALASVYTQLLFAVTEAQVLAVAPGAAWMGDIATDITNVRVVGLPALLPVLALVAALMGKHEDAQTVSAEAHAATVAQLDNMRRDAADLRKDLLVSATAHEAALEQNNVLAEFKRAVTNPVAWHTPTSLTQLMRGTIFKNGNMPETKVVAKITGVLPATISTAIRKMEAGGGE